MRRFLSENGQWLNWPDGNWYIILDGVRYQGEIRTVDFEPENCGIAIWTLQTWDNKIGSAQIDISAPRTRFRKAKEDD